MSGFIACILGITCGMILPGIALGYLLDYMFPDGEWRWSRHRRPRHPRNRS